MLTAKVIVYSDLNCPFCFALNEWITSAGQSKRVKWRGVEHMPKLVPGATIGDVLRKELEDEVATVNSRVGGFALQVPHYRPNTGRALAMLLAAEEHCPDQAADLRMALFRALWRDNKDISDQKVLLEIGARFADEICCDFSDYLGQVDSHTEEWRKYDRIPTLRAATGATYLGLGDQKALSVFMGSALFDMEKEYACFPKS